ncbi:MAG: DNA repair protein RecN [Propionibacteriales bacterium]|nr:DNA repair protein RecN [Propionibacteriales bacterium]
MIEELSISSLGVIDYATLELEPGFNVVTGETGAGKTMVVTALGLLLGARADAGVVREQAERARVNGTIRIDSCPAVARRAEDVGADIDDGTLILGRVVRAEGRSRASAGGAVIPVGTLAALMSELVVVHGQSEQQDLLHPERQRRTLDGFGGTNHQAAFSAYRDAYEQLQAAESELAEVVSGARERAQESDLLRLGLIEVESADPRPGEDAALLVEEQRLAHTVSLRLAAEEAHRALSADEPHLEAHDAFRLVAAARRALDSEREHDPQLAELADQLAATSYLLIDIAADLASYIDGLEVDPERLAWVQDRRATLTALTRKYGDDIDAVLAWSDRAAERVLTLDNDDSRIEKLRARRDVLVTQVATHGSELSKLRRVLGSGLAERVTAELAGLAMPDATFAVVLSPLPAPSRDGLDRVTFSFSAHAGGPPRPLQRGASGGELSRVMLALEVCLAGTRPVPTMIFDEVDAGVGGKAAVEIGRRLARLSRSVQVIAVTHLPQVAAFADQHYVVVKSSNGAVTRSGVTRLDDKGRRVELSRMLAGLEGSDTALAHADELVEVARAERRP